MPIFASTDFFHSLFHASSESIIVMDAQGHVVNFNPAAEKLLGHSSTEVVGQKMVELILLPESQQALFNGKSNEVATGNTQIPKQRIEVEILNSSGTKLDTEVTITRVAINGATYFTACIRDITERKQMLLSMGDALEALESNNRHMKEQMAQLEETKRALAESERKYRSIVESTNEGFWLFSSDDFVIRETNDALCRMLGVEREVVVGKTPLDFIHPQDLRMMRELAPRFSQLTTGISKVYSRPVTERRFTLW